jgi:hypothetical protein
LTSGQCLNRPSGRPKPNIRVDKWLGSLYRTDAVDEEHRDEQHALSYRVRISTRHFGVEAQRRLDRG